MNDRLEIDITILITILGFIFVGILVGYLARRYFSEGKVKKAKELARKIIQEAEKDAETKKKEAVLEAKEYLYKAKTEFEKENKDKRIELQKLENRVIQREENLDRKVDLLEAKEKELSVKEREIEEKDRVTEKLKKRYEGLLEEEIRKLERISTMSSEEAKRQLMLQMKNEARLEAAETIKKIEDETRETANKKANKIIGSAIQRLAADQVVESTVSVVDLPNDEMKGRIIGREGRNIRALEIATGVDLIIDDTPEAVILSSFDPLKREITKIVLERLIADGRIHPGRIEEMVEKVKKEMENTMKEEGEKAAFELGVEGIHPELIKLLGKLKYRTSYSQNILQHSKEVAYFSGIIAGELGLDIKMAKRAGLLHDVGKAVDHQTEGTHTQIGVDLAKKYHEPSVVVNAIAAHHEDVDPLSVEAVIVGAADSLSAARPGARREMLEAYIKRLEKLEEIGSSFEGVDKTYAIQAGREIRVIVQPEKVDDQSTVFLAKDIAKKIEEELSYPGEVKVTVIRETRAVDHAK